MLSCELCEIFKNTFSAEHLWTTASAPNLSGMSILYLKFESDLKFGNSDKKSQGSTNVYIFDSAFIDTYWTAF